MVLQLLRLKFFLKRTYDIELKKYKINAQPHTRWKFNLEKEIKGYKKYCIY